MSIFDSRVHIFFLPLVVLISYSQVALATHFLDAPTFPTGLFPGGVVAADFNRDGRLDLATANFGDATVSVLLNNGDGTFAPHMDFPAGNGGPTFIATGDFNGDGNTDVVVINFEAGGNHNLTLLLGNGDGTLQPPSAPIMAGHNPVYIAVGDFNGDQILDLAVVNNVASGTVSILLGNGDGTFQSPVPYGVGNSPVSVAAGDFNKDGNLDLAVTNLGGTGTVSVLLSNGNGSFQNAMSYAVGLDPESVAIGDLNGDGNLDLATANSQGFDVSLLFGNRDGTFQPAISQPVGASTSPVFVMIADINGDGKQDLVVACGVTADLRLLLGKGDGTFQAPVSYILDSYAPAAGDFDGDGNLDFALAVSDSVNNGVAVLLGNGDGTLRGARSYTAESSMFSVAVGDFNGDGKLDVVTSGAANKGAGVALLTGKGDGTFLNTVNYTVPAGSIFVAVADFNLDGKSDVIAGGTNVVSVLLGQSDGTLQRPLTSPAEQENSFLIVGDFNGDGKPDVAALSPSAGFAVLLGKGDGTFQSPITYTGLNPISGTTGDFNADGKLDLAVSAASDEIWLGNGDGTFQMTASYSGGSGPVVTGDFNRDGKLDLAIADPATNAVNVLLGNGDGTFQSPISYAVVEPTSLVVSDVNGDGKLDLVAGDDQGNIGLLLGKGDGTFQNVINFPDAFPLGLAAGDFNGDGAPDLAFSNGSSIVVSTFLNTGGTLVSTRSSMNPSKFGQPVTFTTTVTPTFPFIGAPTGTITFKDGSKLLGKVILSAGQASLTTSSLNVGKHRISAIYSGDANFNPKSAPILKQKVTH